RAHGAGPFLIPLGLFGRGQLVQPGQVFLVAAVELLVALLELVVLLVGQVQLSADVLIVKPGGAAPHVSAAVNRGGRLERRGGALKDGFLLGRGRARQEGERTQKGGGQCDTTHHKPPKKGSTTSPLRESSVMGKRGESR